MLSHQDVRVTLIDAARLTANLWSVLFWMGRGYIWGGLIIEGNVMTLLQSVYESEFAAKRAYIHSHSEELEAVSKAVLRELIICAVRSEHMISSLSTALLTAIYAA